MRAIQYWKLLCCILNHLNTKPFSICIRDSSVLLSVTWRHFKSPLTSNPLSSHALCVCTTLRSVCLRDITHYPQACCDIWGCDNSMTAIPDPANRIADCVNQYNDSGFCHILDRHMTQETFSLLKASLFWRFLANDLFISFWRAFLLSKWSCVLIKALVKHVCHV